MPKRKRSVEEEIRRYKRKLKRLEEFRTSPNSMGSEQDGEQEEVPEEIMGSPETAGEAALVPDPPQETTTEEVVEAVVVVEPQEKSDIPQVADIVEVEEIVDQEILNILGELSADSEKFGPNISEVVAARWVPTLQKGLKKEDREALMKKYLVPNNCQRLQAPSLNPEVMSILNDPGKNRDKKLEEAQQQLGTGLTALGRAMSLLIKQKGNIEIIKLVNDSARILTDLHFQETTSRKKLITPVMDKSFLELTKDVNHGQYLYGENLSEKIKNLKIIEKSSKAIKKPDFNKTPSANKQGNFSGPPRQLQRYNPATRGAVRGGFKKPAPPQRRAANPAPSVPQHKDTSSSSKHHARR